VAIHPENSVLRVGEAQIFSATVFDENSLAIQNVAVDWESSNQQVVTVDPNGSVKAIARGTAEIHATFSGKSASANVIVR